METLKDLLSSKKFVVLLAGIIALLLTHKLGWSEQEAQEVSTKLVGLVMSYLVGQGIADHQKEAAKINAVSKNNGD